MTIDDDHNQISFHMRKKMIMQCERKQQTTQTSTNKKYKNKDYDSSDDDRPVDDPPAEASRTTTSKHSKKTTHHCENAHF